jgi:aspartate aminotransferase
MISKRVNNMQESPIRKLVPFADEAKTKGIKVYHLNIGQPDIKTPDSVLNAIKNYSSDIIAYGYSQGEPFLRKAISDYFKKYDAVVSPDDMIITTGGSEAILFAFTVVGDIDDEIIVFEPYYTNYNGYAAMSNINLIPVTTKAEDGFALPSSEEIEKKIGEKTRAILLCSPNNPTGTIYPEKDLLRIIEIAKKHNLYIISDEVYREFIYGDIKYKSMLHFEDVKERVIVVDSISKRYSACGARIGYIISKNKDIMKGVMKLAQARLCPPVVEQVAATAAYKMDFRYFKEVQQEYKKRRDIMFDALKEIEGVVLEKPQGAFYMVVKLPINNSDDFAKWLLSDFNYKNETVMVAPAGGFYSTKGKGEDEIRLAYVLEENKLLKSMKIIKEALKEYPDKKR